MRRKGWVNQEKDDQLYLKKMSRKKKPRRHWLTLGISLSQSLASICSCPRLSRSPTSNTTLGNLELRRRTPVSGCFCFSPNWKPGEENKPSFQVIYWLKCTCRSNDPASGRRRWGQLLKSSHKGEVPGDDGLRMC